MRSALDRTRARLAGGDDRGITLIELLVATLIFSILLTLVVSAYSTLSRSITLAGAVDSNVKLSSLGMNEISKVLRFAATNPVLGHPINDPAFVTADVETLTVYSYVDANATTPAPVKVTFSLNASRQLVEQRYAGTATNGFWSFASTPSVTRILTGAVIAPSAGERPLFSYQTVTNGTYLTVPSGGLTASQLPQVAAVTVTMKIKGASGAGGGASSPMTISNTVGLPNLGLARTGQDMP
nr:type II secretion system protein [Galbitalea soli]